MIFVRYLLREDRENSSERFCLVPALLPVDKFMNRGNVLSADGVVAVMKINQVCF